MARTSREIIEAYKSDPGSLTPSELRWLRKEMDGRKSPATSPQAAPAPEHSGDRMWFTRADAAALCGIGARHFDEKIRPRLPADAFKGDRASLRFSGPAIVQTMIAYRTKPQIDDESDPLLVGSGSPALERYRTARANLAELDLAERDSAIIHLPILARALSPAISALRATGNRLTRMFGNEAGEIYNEGVTDFEAAALQAIANDSRDNFDPQLGGVDADAPAADAL